MPASRIAELERENARLSSALEQSNAALTELQSNFQVLKQQLECFKRQLFGEKSEKRLDIDPEEQGNLLAALGVEAPPRQDEPTIRTVSYQRRNKVRDGAVNDSGLRFDDAVPVKTIEVKDPAVQGIPENLREVIGEKVTYRLAQQPGSYVVLKYVRPVVKRKDNLKIVTAAAPGQVLERTAADVSFLAGMLLDKFCYHLPIYRQHQRLRDSGIVVSRSSLNTWASRGHRPACAGVRGAKSQRAPKPRIGHGRDLDQGRTQDPGQDANRVVVADVRGPRRGRVPLRTVARTPSRASLSRGVPRHAPERRL